VHNLLTLGYEKRNAIPGGGILLRPNSFQHVHLSAFVLGGENVYKKWKLYQARIRG
jgi:hypothetical protein